MAGFAATAEGSTQAETVGPESGIASREPEGPEIESARTATSNTFRLPDGAHEVRIYPAPVNYKDEEGGWKPVEEELEPTTGGGFTNGANSFELTLPHRLGAAPVRVEGTHGEWVSDRLLGSSSEAAEVEDDTASYEAASPGTVFELSSTPTGVEEAIELESPSQQSSFDYELDASQGVTPSLEGDGSVAFRQKDGTEIARIPAPTVTDGAPGMKPDHQAVHYELASLPDGNWKLELETEKAWLESPERVWPVVIDPSIEGEVGAGQQCAFNWIEPVKETWYHCLTEDNDEEGVSDFNYNGENYTERAVMVFWPGASIPADASIESASIDLYAPASLPESIGAIQLRRVTSPWNGIKTTWTTWNTPGGDFVNEGSELSPTTRGRAAGWWDFEEGVTNLVYQWLSGEATDDGVLLKLANETPTACGICRYSFKGYGSGAESPYLNVKYFPRAPVTSKLVSPTEGTHTARRLKLKSKWTSAGVEGVTYQYREGKTGRFRTIPAELVRNAEGKMVSWPIPEAFAERETKPLYLDAAHLTSPLQKKGGIVQVRALFEGPTGVAGYSAPVETVVDRGTGGPKDPTAEIGPGTVDLLTGDFSTSDTDVSIPTFNSSLEFGRTYNSRPSLPALGTREEVVKKESTSAMGPGWKPGVTLEEAGGSSWRNLQIITESGVQEEEFEGEVERFEYSFSYALLTTVEGDELAFERNANGTFIAPPEVTGWTLIAEAGNLVLSDPSGVRTTFSPATGNEYTPTAISIPGASVGATTEHVEYELSGGTKRIHAVYAPAMPGISCSGSSAISTEGCKTLVFSYTPATWWGAPAADGERLHGLFYYAPGVQSGLSVVIEYNYDTQGRLIEAWDPRISPPLKEKYTYGTSGEIKTITPPGQEPWTLEYSPVEEEEGVGRLTASKRPSLLASPVTAQTTIAYNVPVNGAGAPYEMGGTSVAQWGQADIPADATAIFPPDQVPSSPPSSYSHATVYYMDAEGHEVNVATAAGAGTANPSISTSEIDEYGNAVRELTPDNRIRVLAEPECKVFTESGCQRRIRSEDLDIMRTFGAEGTQLEEEEGPEHSVAGGTTGARFHKVIQYDRGMPAGTTPDPHLPTRATTGAMIGGVLHEERVTETEYNWALRKPTKNIVVMESGKPNIESVIVYDEPTGLPVEISQPKNKSGGGPGTTQITYYGSGSGAACVNSAYAGMVCRAAPAAQPGTPGQPELLVKKYQAYDALGEPTETSESPGGNEAKGLRRTIATYDAAGRPLTRQIVGGGTEVRKTETLYSATTGAPYKQQFSSGTNREATTTTYNAIGQVTEYEDADGNKAKPTYDIDGRTVKLTDNKGSQTITYDPTSGLATKLEDSAAGIFTASYDADGNMVERTLPDGLTAKTTFNEVDEPVKLSYTKTSSCGASCTWLEEHVERSIYGQILNNTGTLVSDQYLYDKAGRLSQAEETPSGGICTTRGYKYDLDSNRESQTTTSGVGGACSTSGGSERKYEYDSADRLLGGGITYDAFGRITNLPAEDAGGHALATSYYGTNMVATQGQNGITNSYELDATGRQRARLQGGGGLEGTEVFHYDAAADSPAWTERGTTWTRNISGLGGELAAVQESGTGVTLQLTDLHGDVVATAEPSTSATKLKATYRFDEFGEPMSGSAGRFGWLGGKARRTELPSGVIQMGARSYVPAIGRFLTPDPIRGGSANAYDYADQDPVNGYDLNGEWQSPGKKVREAIAKVRAKTHRVERQHSVRAPSVACSGKGGCHPTGNYGGGNSVNQAIEGLGAKLLHSFTIQNPGSLTWENVKASVNTWFGAGSSATVQAAYGCAKSSWEAFGEVKPLFEVPGGAAPAGGWVLLKCAVGGF